MLTVYEVADLLKISHKTVRVMIHKGEIPAYKFGGQYRCREEDVQNYISSRKVQLSA